MKHILLICLLLTTGNVLAQERFEEHRAKLTKDFSGFKSTIMDDYKGFRDQILKEYCEALKQAWENVEALSSTKLPVENHIPPVVFSDKERKKQELQPLIDEIIQPEPPKPQPTPTIPVEPIPEVTRQKLNISFMGTAMEVRKPKGELPILGGCNRDGVALLWEALSDRAYDSLIEDCLQLRSTHHLCDWAYLLFLRQLSQTIYEQKSNEAALLMAYLYGRSGYKMRLAITDNGHVRMLYATHHCIFNKNCWQLDGTLFYAMDYDGDEVLLCNASLPEEKPLSLYVEVPQQFTVRQSGQRELQSERYPEVKATVIGNLNQMEFFNTYPPSMVNQDACTRWAMYANTPMDELSKQTLYPSLKNAIAGCSQLEAAERLLNFVQTAFVYEYDDKVWGYDRAFFAEETLFYPYCDCEDRSILFSHLMRELLGVEVVLIYYPGHLATAVHFTDSVQGDFILLDGKKFTICDPTYIGAPVGYTMTGMDNRSCKVVLLNSPSV